MTDAFISAIFLWCPNWAPRNYQNCEGQIMSIASNTALFSLLGTTFGGNGTTTFALPDFRGRFPLGYNPSGGGLSTNVIGEAAGTENTSILISNLPAHTHIGAVTNITGALNASTTQATQDTPGASGANTLGAFWDPTNAEAISGYVADATPAVPLTGLAITGGAVTNSLTGNNIPISIMPPYLVINYIICIYGIFPSRN